MTWVIPCFNEERRLDRAQVAELASAGHGVLLVDDGSSDGTLGVLRELAAAIPEVSVLALEQNGGKAEAVRRGLLQASGGVKVVGFADADFSTPARELIRLFNEQQRLGAAVVIGSRVALAGKRIERKASRHYLGRIFASAASFLLDAVIYDTQCGAKVFAVSPLLTSALDEPFVSRWIFDVELLGRLFVGGPGLPGLRSEGLVEVPLEEWRDVAGSKLSFRAMSKVPLLLLSTRRRLQARRQALRA